MAQDTVPVSYLEALRLAQEKALTDDPRVFLYGQDIGNFGGAFKATKNLAQRFPGRVLDAPISEDAMVGAAIGAAIEGMRPVVEMQFADFSTCGLNQIVNHAATLFYRTEVPCPIVIRLPSGGTVGAGPFHSQTLESIYAHFPGLIVMTPATVADAYSMLLEAIALDDPVIFCEHKLLYNHLKKEPLPTTWEPFYQARIVIPRNQEATTPSTPIKPSTPRESHATIITHGAMFHEAWSSAKALLEEGFQVEVVDLRSVKPLDEETILSSIARTGRVLIVAENFPYGGVAAEVAALIGSRGFAYLDAPIERLLAKDTPIPYHPNLWHAHRPSNSSIMEAVQRLLRY